ncbi:hypothetical protein CDD83_7319 [Cordyceps sp. RAO-2017]|nr:hypothetical protein CDD83_7319 [Cordyceps sp. RAO-2017]
MQPRGHAPEAEKADSMPPSPRTQNKTKNRRRLTIVRCRAAPQGHCAPPRGDEEGRAGPDPASLRRGDKVPIAKRAGPDRPRASRGGGSGGGGGGAAAGAAGAAAAAGWLAGSASATPPPPSFLLILFSFPSLPLQEGRGGVAVDQEADG